MEEVLESGVVSAAAAEFGPFDGRVWLNTAHQGSLPQSAVRAAGQDNSGRSWRPGEAEPDGR
jgi:hypothetical protein